MACKRHHFLEPIVRLQVVPHDPGDHQKRDVVYVIALRSASPEKRAHRPGLRTARNHRAGAYDAASGAVRREALLRSRQGRALAEPLVRVEAWQKALLGGVRKQARWRAFPSSSVRTEV